MPRWYRDETRTSRRLSWLAWNMRKHGKTIFELEGLQPTWLLPPSYLYFLAADIALGLAIGLTVAPLAYVTTDSIWKEWPHVLFASLMSGAALGVVVSAFSYRRHRSLESERRARGQAQRPAIAAEKPPATGPAVAPLVPHRPPKPVRPRSPRGGSLFSGCGWLGCLPGLASSIGVIAFLFVAATNYVLSSQMARDLGAANVVSAMFVVVAFVLFRLMDRGRLRTDGRYVFATETFGWSPRDGLRTALVALPIAGVLAFVMARLLEGWLIGIGRSWQREGGWHFVFILEWSFLVFIGLWAAGVVAAAVLGSMRPRVLELTTRPNEGMVRSLRTAALAFVSVGLPTAIAAAIPIYFDVGSAASAPAFFGAAGGIAFLLRGGIGVIRHYLLRATLVLRGVAPLDYDRFLDFAAVDLGFLQRVGGDYVFMHRYLLEYFAAMSTEVGVLEAVTVKDVEGRPSLQPIPAASDLASLPIAAATFGPASEIMLLPHDLEAAGRVWIQEPARIRLLEAGEWASQVICESPSCRGRRMYVQNSRIRLKRWVFRPDPVATDAEIAAANRPRSDVHCPKCAWSPWPAHSWRCVKCGHRWHVFTTGGKCPYCEQQMRKVTCVSCQVPSPYQDWLSSDAAPALAEHDMRLQNQAIP